MHDKEFVNKLIEGDQFAWNTFYEESKRLIYWVITKTFDKQGIIPSKEDFEDCEQFIWTSFLEKNFHVLKKWEGKCSFDTWVRTCSVTLTRDFLKLKNKIHSHEIYSEDISQTARNPNLRDLEKDIDNKDLLEEVEDIINNDLNGRESFLANLFFFEELPYKTISSIMNIPTRNIHLLKHRITKKIKRMI